MWSLFRTGRKEDRSSHVWPQAAFILLEITEKYKELLFTVVFNYGFCRSCQLLFTILETKSEKLKNINAFKIIINLLPVNKNNIL